MLRGDIFGDGGDPFLLWLFNCRRFWALVLLTWAGGDPFIRCRGELIGSFRVDPEAILGLGARLGLLGGIDGGTVDLFCVFDGEEYKGFLLPRIPHALSVSYCSSVCSGSLGLLILAPL